MGDWYVMGKGVGIKLESSLMRWIYWAPGRKTQEGAWTWKEVHEIFGVSRGIRAYYDHMCRPDSEVIDDLEKAGILDCILAKIAARSNA